MATCSNILASKIPWIEEPGGQESWDSRESDTTEHAGSSMGQGSSWEASPMSTSSSSETSQSWSLRAEEAPGEGRSWLTGPGIVCGWVALMADTDGAFVVLLRPLGEAPWCLKPWVLRVQVPPSVKIPSVGSISYSQKISPSVLVSV